MRKLQWGRWRAAARVIARRRTPKNVMPAKLKELFEQLQRGDPRLDLRALVATLRESELNLGDLAPYARFGLFRYRRNPLFTTPALQAMLLCWRPGQESPIHDHRGSACAVKILSGVATETVFELNPTGRTSPLRQRRFHERTVAGSLDADIHRIANAEKKLPLVTLHVYSPPLTAMRLYKPEREPLALPGSRQGSRVGFLPAPA